MLGLNGHFDTKGKNCIVSGGSQGLGLEISKRIVKSGGNVVIVARTEKKLVKAVEELEKLRQNDEQVVRYVAADISAYSGCERVLEGIEPEVVICCAGASTPKMFEELTGDELDNGIRVNYNTAVFLAHAAYKKMVKTQAKGRHIVFFSSVLADFPVPGYLQYSPLKGAIRNLADSLRLEASAHDIRVSCVFPGNFASEGFEEEELTKPSITKLIEGPSDPIPVEKCCDIVLGMLDYGYDTVSTDFIGWVLHSLMPGIGPLVFTLPQAILGFVLALVSPIVRLVLVRMIRGHKKPESDKKKS